MKHFKLFFILGLQNLVCIFLHFLHISVCTPHISRAQNHTWLVATFLEGAALNCSLPEGRNSASSCQLLDSQPLVQWLGCNSYPMNIYWILNKWIQPNFHSSKSTLKNSTGIPVHLVSSSTWIFLKKGMKCGTPVCNTVGYKDFPLFRQIVSFLKSEPISHRDF